MIYNKDSISEKSRVQIKLASEDKLNSLNRKHKITSAILGTIIFILVITGSILTIMQINTGNTWVIIVILFISYMAACEEHRNSSDLIKISINPDVLKEIQSGKQVN